MADPQRMETTCASERQGHIIQLRGRKIIQVPSRSYQCGADNLISVFVKVEVSWHAVLRFRASRGTPSTAVRSGTLLVFPSPWSSTTVRWSVPAFLSGCRVGPRRSGNVRSNPHASWWMGLRMSVDDSLLQRSSLRAQAETCGG